MKVLCVVNNLRSCNGVTTVLMNQYSAVATKYEVDFLQIAEWENVYETAIVDNGGHIYTMPKVKKKFDKLTFSYLKKLFTSQKYDIVHVNLTDLYAAIILFEAKKARVPIIIYHSHNPRLQGKSENKIKKLIYDTLCVHFANEYAACSHLAGESIFGKRKFAVLKNTMDAECYVFNKNSRKKIRQDLSILDDDIVIGSVGRYAEQKNPLFAYEVFKILHEENNKIKYIWVGSEGICEDIIRQSIDRDNLQDAFFMVGSRDDANAWYSAFDLFLLPSLFEGFGNVLIEAQISGCPVFTSDRVPSETKITNLIHYLSLNASANEWAHEISRCVDTQNNLRVSHESEARIAGFDSKTSDHILLDYYDAVSKKCLIMK